LHGQPEATGALTRYADMGKRWEIPKSRSWFASAVLRPPLGAMQTAQEFSGALFCEGALVDYSPRTLDC
jgi:hypothetical protein